MTIALGQYFNRRQLTILLLGFASGLPLALTSTTLQAWLTISGVDIVTIGIFGLVGLPYIYKFLWSPLMDRYIPPLLGRRRGWILLTQLVLILTMAGLALFSPQTHMFYIGVLALVIAFFSASQDVAIDAYRTDLLPAQERGLGAAMGVGGYRIGMLVSGGLALIMADYIGWRSTYLLISSLMLLGIIASLWGPEPIFKAAPPQSLQAAIIKPFAEFYRRKNAIMMILFILLYKLGDAFTATSGSVTTTFFLRELAFSLTTVGTLTKTLGIFATILGVFLAGVLMIRLRLYIALMAFGILQGVTNLLYILLAIAGKNYSLMASVIFLDNLCAGMGTAALVALLMSLCDHRYTATQFALLLAIAALPRVVASPVAGIMVFYMGWVQFFWWSFIVAIPALILLWTMKDEISRQEIAYKPNYKRM